MAKKRMTVKQVCDEVQGLLEDLKAAIDAIESAPINVKRRLAYELENFWAAQSLGIDAPYPLAVAAGIESLTHADVTEVIRKVVLDSWGVPASTDQQIQERLKPNGNT